MEFDIITLGRSLSWLLVSLVALIGARDYFKVNTPKSKVVYHMVRISAWLFIVFNTVVAIYILVNM